MANFSLDVADGNRNFDDPLAKVAAFDNGNTVTINGPTLTVNSDVRWGQNAAVMGPITVSPTLGGKVLFDGRDIWEINFDASTGNVPTLAVLGSNGVTGGSSGATGELLRVWAAGELVPRAAGGAMPTSGYIKLRTKTGTFEDNEVITLPGGATVTVNSATGGKRSWLQIVGARTTTVNIPRLGKLEVFGDWYYLNDTDGTDNQSIPLPFIEYLPAIQIETAPGSNVYEWWLNAGDRWQTGHTEAVSFIPDDARGKYFGQILRRTDAATTTGTANVDVADTTGMIVGAPVALSAGFADLDNLYISSIVSGTRITVSTNSNATGTARSIATCPVTIRLANRGTYTCGLKPPSGCKIRIPNIIVGTTTAGPNDSNLWRGQISEGVGGDRWDLTTTAGGAIQIDKLSNSAHFCGTSAAYSVNITNTSTFVHSHANTATIAIIEDGAVGISRGNSGNSITMSNQFTGVTMRRVRAVRHLDGSNTTSVTLNDCANIILEDVQSETFGSTTDVTRGTSSGGNLALTRCFDATITRPLLVGGKLKFSQVTRATVTDVRHADLIGGATTATNPSYAVEIADTSSSIMIDGLTPFADLANVHPYNHLLFIGSSASTVEFRNVGTPSAPYDMGTVNACGGIMTASVCLNVILRRVYVINTRLTTQVLALANTIQNALFVNVLADYADTQSVQAIECLIQGARWTNLTTGQSSVYGRHWEDAFTSATTGRILIACNEPLPSTASQAVLTAADSSGYTSAGSLSMGTLADSVVWTMPYAALGHTGFCPSAIISPFGLTGTNTDNHKYDYQISTNGTFSSWKRFVTVVKRAFNGTAGTNNFVMTAKPDDMPQIGDYISSTVTDKVPAGTTVTNVVGNTITLSANFINSLGTNEILHTWKDIQDEPVIDPATGVSLKVRATVITANGTNALTYITVNTVSDATSQQIQYPLPLDYTLTINSNVSLAGAEIRIYDMDNIPAGSFGTELTGVESNPSSTFAYNYGSAPNDVWIQILKDGYVEYGQPYTLTASVATLTATLQADNNA